VAGRRRLGVARRQLGLILRLLVRETVSGPRLNLRPGLGQLLQALLTARQFLGDRQAVGEIRPVCRFGLGQQVGHLGFQLRLDPTRMLVGQRAVTAGLGVELGAVQGHRAHLEQTHFACQEQDLSEQSPDLLEKPPPKCRDGVMVGMFIRRDEAEGHGIVGRPLQFTAREHPGCIAVHPNAQEQRRVIGGRTGPAIALDHRAQVQLVDHLHHKARQVRLRQPLVHRQRQQKSSLTINHAEVVHPENTPTRAPNQIDSTTYHR
jgi:hypothetical protein